MQKRRAGFTLIELLIVIVIIGILAAIAIPKFGKTREKAYFKAMMSDLRNLNAQEEIYYSNPANTYSYAATIGALTDFVTSKGVTVAFPSAGSNLGWNATSSHVALGSTQWCAVYSGPVAFSVTGAGATQSGVISCTGE
jgi:prepilin-type N-terminal cleavage/methylation domain-containing protein